MRCGRTQNCFSRFIASGYVAGCSPRGRDRCWCLEAFGEAARTSGSGRASDERGYRCSSLFIENGCRDLEPELSVLLQLPPSLTYSSYVTSRSTSVSNEPILNSWPDWGRPPEAKLPTPILTDERRATQEPTTKHTFCHPRLACRFSCRSHEAMRRRPMFLMVSYAHQTWFSRKSYCATDNQLKISQAECERCSPSSVEVSSFSLSATEATTQRFGNSPLNTIVIALLVTLVGGVDDTTSIPRSCLHVGHWPLLWERSSICRFHEGDFTRASDGGARPGATLAEEPRRYLLISCGF